MAEESHIHKGHRQRLKARFLAEGLEHFHDINVLELLLFYCVPRKDTNPLAHRLLDRFGKLHMVLEAPYEELMKVEGVNTGIATFLTLFHALGRYCVKNRAEEVAIVQNITQCGEYLLPYFHALQKETVYLLCLDAKCKVLACKKVGEGSVNSASISIRKIVETALGTNAVSVVLAHNHPSGLAIPSPEDIHTTKRLGRALHAVEIVLVDHLVIADDEFVSIAQSGKYSPYENQEF